jgi:hypothetical protein
MWFTVAGLLFDIAGAWLLAYEIIWGFPKRQHAKYVEIRLQHLRKDHELLRSNIGKLPCPPYTEAELDKLREEHDATWIPMIQRNEEEIRAATTGHEDKSMIAALLGIAFLTIGFVLQIAGAFKP